MHWQSWIEMLLKYKTLILILTLTNLPYKKKTKKMSEHIVFVGESGFPMGLAAIQRLTLMAKAFIHGGCSAMVICRKGVGTENKKLGFAKNGNFEGIDYIYTSKDVYKPVRFLERNVQKLMGMYGEISFLIKLKEKNEIDLVIVSEMSVVHMFRYLMYSKFLNVPIVINFVEMASSMQNRSNLLLRINDYLIDHWALKQFDGALAISKKLLDYYDAISPSKPCLKLPILCDFEKFEVERETGTPYFLYCGSLGYRPVIDFIIEAYQILANNQDTKLYMIVSGGTNREVTLLEQKINKLFDHKPVMLFSNIPYEQLVHLYINAIALLIPLRPTIQDSSRFPHKIGEYLASGNPVITTNIGEIKNYFEDGSTALIADKYEIDLFAEKMRFVLEHPEKAKKIGENGKKLGLEEFHYKTHGCRLRTFLKDLANQS